MLAVNSFFENLSLAGFFTLVLRRITIVIAVTAGVNELTTLSVVQRASDIDGFRLEVPLTKWCPTSTRFRFADAVRLRLCKRTVDRSLISFVACIWISYRLHSLGIYRFLFGWTLVMGRAGARPQYVVRLAFHDVCILTHQLRHLEQFDCNHIRFTATACVYE
jgi:hypothetical protein